MLAPNPKKDSWWKRVRDAAFERARRMFRRAQIATDSFANGFTKETAEQQAVRVTEAALLRARSGGNKSRTNPFALPEFPPAARPPKGAQMAMDDGFSWASGEWNRGSAFSAIFAEGLAFPGYTALAEQAQRAEFRRFAEILATEMTRKWIRLQSVGDRDKSDKIKQIVDALDNLRARDAFRRCIELDELFGRAHLYIDTGATEDRDELKTSIGNGRDNVSRTKVGKGSLRVLRPVEPVWVYPTSYNADDPLSDNWYEPETWFVMGKEVHASRLLKFVGREVPDLLKPAYSFGGLSMTQMSKPYVDNWLRTRQSVADLIHAFSVFVLKTDLGTSLEDGGDLLFKRVDLFNVMRDNRGMMVVNKETEELSNVSAPLGGLEQLQAQTQEHLASVSGIPIVKLLGIQPTGLNASDEGGIRMFYDWVAASQEKRMRAQLTTVIDFVMISLWGEVDNEITFVFEPLWALDEKAEADKREVEARTDVSLIDSGVLTPEEVRKKVAADPDSPYASIDVEDVPDLREEEEAGLDPRAGKGARTGRPPHPQPSNEQGEAFAAPGGREDHEDHEPEEEEEEEDSAIQESLLGGSGKVDPGPWQKRIAARNARHLRREGDFYDRADVRSEQGRDYLKRRIGAKGAIGADDKWSEALLGTGGIDISTHDKSPDEDRDPPFARDARKFEESKHKRDKSGKFAKKEGGGGSGVEAVKSKSPAKISGNPRVSGTESERTRLRGLIQQERDSQVAPDEPKTAPAKDSAVDERTVFVVVRHGATKMNDDTDTSVDRIRAWLDVPLTSEGRDQAEETAEELQDYDLVALYSSDLIRAAETAVMIGEELELTPIITKTLRPWNLGRFTGQTTKEALPEIAEYVRERPTENVPEGESFLDFKTRFFGGLADIAEEHPGEVVGVVTHHRGERLIASWVKAGQPADHELDLKTFLQKGDAPGKVRILKTTAALLRGNTEQVAGSDPDE